MKYRLVLRGDFQKSLYDYFFPEGGDCLERYGVVFLTLSHAKRMMKTFIPVKLWLPEDKDYRVRSAGGLSMQDEYAIRYWEYARDRDYFPMTVHSHPFDKTASIFFSGTDNTNDRNQLEFFGPMLPNSFYVTAVMNATGTVACRFFETKFPERPSKNFDEILYCDFPLRKQLPSYSNGSFSSPGNRERYDRQIRAFGKEGQDMLEKMRVCLAGVGGLGAVLVEILARLGVSDFILIDHDVAETTNLNRFPGMYKNDVHQNRLKVKIARRLIKRINPDAKVRCIDTKVYESRAVDAMKCADIVFLSTDNVTSRDFVNKFCIQYLMPCISLGSVIEYSREKQRINSILGEMVMMVPGSRMEKFCLICSGVLNTDFLKLENAPENLTERLAGYIRGDVEPAPAVRYLNGIVANIAAGEFHNLVCAFKEPMPCQHINLMPVKTFYDDFFEEDFLRFLHHLEQEDIVEHQAGDLKEDLLMNFTESDGGRRKLKHRFDEKGAAKICSRYVKKGIVKHGDRFMEELRNYFSAESAEGAQIITPIDLPQQESSCPICGPKAYRMAEGDLAELEKFSF